MSQHCDGIKTRLCLSTISQYRTHDCSPRMPVWWIQSLSTWDRWNDYAAYSLKNCRKKESLSGMKEGLQDEQSSKTAWQSLITMLSEWRIWWLSGIWMVVVLGLDCMVFWIPLMLRYPPPPPPPPPWFCVPLPYNICPCPNLTHASHIAHQMRFVTKFQSGILGENMISAFAFGKPNINTCPLMSLSNSCGLSSMEYSRPLYFHSSVAPSRLNISNCVLTCWKAQLMQFLLEIWEFHTGFGISSGVYFCHAGQNKCCCIVLQVNAVWWSSSRRVEWGARRCCSQVSRHCSRTTVMHPICFCCIRHAGEYLHLDRLFILANTLVYNLQASLYEWQSHEGLFSCDVYKMILKSLLLAQNEKGMLTPPKPNSSAHSNARTKMTTYCPIQLACIDQKLHKISDFQIQGKECISKCIKRLKKEPKLSLNAMHWIVLSIYSCADYSNCRQEDRRKTLVYYGTLVDWRYSDGYTP